MADCSNTLIAIYVLRDPTHQSKQLYVGQTENVFARRSVHASEGRAGLCKSRRGVWLKELLARGIEPDLEVLEWVDLERADEAERSWIASLREQGLDLVNGNAGGGRSTARRQAKTTCKQRHYRITDADYQSLYELANRFNVPTTVFVEALIRDALAGRVVPLSLLDGSSGCDTAVKILS